MSPKNGPERPIGSGQSMAAFGGEAIKNCSTRDMSGSGLMPRKLSQFPYSAGRNFLIRSAVDLHATGSQRSGRAQRHRHEHSPVALGLRYCRAQGLGLIGGGRAGRGDLRGSCRSRWRRHIRRSTRRSTIWRATDFSSSAWGSASRCLRAHSPATHAYSILHPPRYAGSSNRTRSPPPSAAASVMSPPCSRAMVRATARPRPTPPVSRLRESSSR
jgi:hypothetical protein